MEPLSLSYFWAPLKWVLQSVSDHLPAMKFHDSVALKLYFDEDFPSELTALSGSVKTIWECFRIFRFGAILPTSNFFKFLIKTSIQAMSFVFSATEADGCFFHFAQALNLRRFMLEFQVAC